MNEAPSVGAPRVHARDRLVPSVPSSPLQAGDPLIGKTLSHYRIVEKVGAGGMATVYLADDFRHHRKVAIKVMRADLAAAIGQDRFLCEIEIAARLSHPHILPLFDSGAAHGQLYYVMPYVAGESLRARLTREKQLPLEEALRLTREIASALGYAHHQGLVHRDIKPENVLLAEGIALVADFGIARVLSAGDATGSGETRAVTQTGVTIGTPKYMAPEQAQGSGNVDGRADLYALACVLYEMLAGQPPFTGATTETILRQHLTVIPRPVTEHRPTVPGAVAAAIAKGLAKLPADRYATAARFAEALATAGSSGPTPTPSPVGSETATPNNLPLQRTHFIGREKELAECARLLSDSRLLTLTGIGGCGKTRLALRLAESLLETFPDGVWFVDLAPVQDPSRVALTVAATLGLREEPGRPLFDTLTGHLSGKRALLVLDNCEHVIGASAELSDAVLSHNTALKLLVTSREGLGIEGERLFGVQSMSVPVGTIVDLPAVEASEAVRLFVDRARLVEPRFSLDGTNATAITEICRRLDGIPLAIEFAAARVKVLSVEEISAKLDDRFRLLTGGSRAVPRHQTLQATIQWSYEHLTGEEQQLLRQLSVFAGGWTLDAATAVAGQGADEFAVLDLLTHLVDKSLVIVERVESAGSRYRMLETVRQFAQERLDESGESDGARTRHLEFYVALAEEAERKLYTGPEQKRWLSRLDLERENVLSAHVWCDRAVGGAQLGLKLVFFLRRYWTFRGLLALGYRVTVEAVGREGAQGRTLARGRALEAASRIGYFRACFEEAKEFLEESVAIAGEVGDKAGMAEARWLRGTYYHKRGANIAAREQLEESLSLAREMGDHVLYTWTLMSLAELDRFTGDLDRAETRYAECLALCREQDSRQEMAVTLMNLASVSIERGVGSRARDFLLESLQIIEDLGLMITGADLLDVFAGLAALQGDSRSAARMNGASERRRVEMGSCRDPADEGLLAPLIAKARATLGDEAFAAAQAAGRALSYEAALVEVRAWLEAGVAREADA